MNVGLLDARGTGAIFGSLRRQFTPVEFFDLCSIIEELVLRERVILVGKFQKLPRNFKWELQPFINEQVCEINLQPTRLVNLPPVNKSLAEMIRSGREAELFCSTQQDASHEVTRLLGAEIDLKAPTTPLLRHLAHFGSSRRPHIDNDVCDLRAQYGKIAGALDDWNWHQTRTTGVKYIAIPPLGLECIQRCYSFEQIPDRILELRHEYRHLRDKMIELAAILSDPKLSKSKYISLISSWSERWNSCLDTPSGHVLGIGISNIELLVKGQEVTEAVCKSNYLKALKSVYDLVNAGSELWQLRLFRPMHRTVHNYLSASPSNMCMEVSRIFEISPHTASKQMSLVGCANTNLWKAALGNIGSVNRRVAA
ncbi:MAG: hypothetical protein ACFCUR_11440 [Rhodomicrobiaceae bacterium]